MKEIKMKIKFCVKNETAKWLNDFENSDVLNLIRICTQQYARGIAEGIYIENNKNPKHTKY